MDAAKVLIQVLDENQMLNRRQKKTARHNNPGRNCFSLPVTDGGVLSAFNQNFFVAACGFTWAD